MAEKLSLIEQLPEKLGLPERYGRVALAETFTPTELAQLHFPELARVYELLPGELGG